MADQGYPPVPPVSPVAQPVAAAVEPPRRSRAWMWWTLGMLALVAVIVTSCALPFILLFSSDGITPTGGEAVAVVHIDGIIAGTGDLYSGYITPEYMLDILDQAAEDDDVKAVVLRIDSPGGTVAASEEIAEYIRSYEKPVVVSIGDIGASGAYMIASQSDEIWANPGSAVGSIGVITEIPNASRLLDKIGVEFQVITAGENKDTGSPYRALTDKERDLIQGEVDEVYDQFIDIVAKGRKMKRDEVEELATGWAWSGKRAKKLGLVDKIGTYNDALDAAADRGGIEGDYDTVTYDEELGPLLDSLLGIEQGLSRLTSPSSIRDSAARRSVPR